MKNILKKIPALLCVIFMLGGCDDTKDFTGMTLFDALAEENSEKYADFVQKFDEENFISLDYYAGNGTVFHTQSPALIKGLYNELSRTVLESGHKKGGVSTSDAGKSLIFKGGDGKDVPFYFEQRRASVGSSRYDCSNADELESFMERIKEDKI